MEALQPEEGAVDEEARHFRAAEIVDRRVPVGVEAAARIGVLVESRAVEAAEAVRIDGKVRRHPVEDDADAGGVRAVDEAGEAGRIAEAGGRREQAGRLVAPGRVERVLGDRQELDMGEAEIRDIGDQLVGELVIGEEAAVGAAPPRAEMDLVDRHRRTALVAARPGAEIDAVGPVKGAGSATTEAVFGRISEANA